MSILDDLVRAERRDVRERLERVPLRELRAAVRDCPPPKNFAGALRRRDRIALIAEFKRASPAKGVLADRLDPAQTATEFVRSGADAVSVLTSRQFGGARADLEAVRRAVEVPILRKDFTTHEYAIWEARAWGADAVLLIARILERGQLADYIALARELGLEAMVEVFDEKDLERALAANPGVVGVNNRDLETFRVDISRSLRMRELVPREAVFVSESGITSAAQIRELRDAGTDAVLIGEEIIRAPDRGAKIRELLA